MIRGTLVLFGVLASGGAQPAAPSPQEAAAIQQAQQAEAAGRLEEAVAQLERAYELGGDPELLFHLGDLTSRLRQDVRALRLYRAYVARDLGGKDRPAAERRITALEQHTPPPVAAGATVATTPAPGPAPANSSGRVPAAAAAVKPPATASDPVTSSGGGTSATAAPPPAKPPAPGAPDLGAPAIQAAAPAPAPPAGLTAVGSLSTKPPLPRWVPWAGLTATVGLAVAATVSGLSASDRYDQLHSSCGATSAGCTQGQIDDVRSRANGTTILWVAAGVMAAATGAAFYVNTREADFFGVWRF